MKEQIWRVPNGNLACFCIEHHCIYARKKFYYKNNVIGTENLMAACIGTKVKNFIFSSTSNGLLISLFETSIFEHDVIFKRPMGEIQDCDVYKFERQGLVLASSWPGWASYL